MSIPTKLVSTTVFTTRIEIIASLFTDVFGWTPDLRAQQEEWPHYSGVQNITTKAGQPCLRLVMANDTTWRSLANLDADPTTIALSVPDAEIAAQTIKEWTEEHQVRVRATYLCLRQEIVTIDGLAANIWLISSDPVIWRDGNHWNVICIKYIPEFLAANRVLIVVLPKDEFERLQAGGLEELRKGVSPEAAELLILREQYSVYIGDQVVNGPVLLLCRTGRCR